MCYPRSDSPKICPFGQSSSFSADCCLGYVYPKAVLWAMFGASYCLLSVLIKGFLLARLRAAASSYSCHVATWGLQVRLFCPCVKLGLVALQKTGAERAFVQLVPNFGPRGQFSEAYYFEAFLRV